MIRLKGRVRSGVGDFAQWIKKLEMLYEKKAGFKLFPGTLNLELDQPFNLPPNCIRLEASEYGGQVSVSLLECKIFGRKAFILRTDANAKEQGHHPRTIIEIATDIKLRTQFNLKDGDWVEVVI